MAKATIRKKPISGGRQTLYLDYYAPILHPGTGKLVRREYLKVCLFNKPRTELERETQQGYLGYVGKSAFNAADRGAQQTLLIYFGRD